MLPAVNEDSYVSSFFFVAFMLIVDIWLLNLCLGLVYQHYQRLVNKRFVQHYKTRRKALFAAYLLLDVDDKKAIAKPDFLAAVRRVKNLTDEQDHELHFLWQMCDKDGDGTLDGEEFFAVCDILVCAVIDSGASAYAVPSPYDSGFQLLPSKEERKVSTNTPESEREARASWRARRERASSRARFTKNKLSQYAVLLFTPIYMFWAELQPCLSPLFEPPSPLFAWFVFVA